MPIENGILKTKVRGINNREAQRTLNRIKEGDMAKIHIVKNNEVVCFLPDEMPIHLGYLKTEYIPFIQNSIRTNVEFAVTGGSYLIYDENEILFKEVDHIRDLPIFERDLITKGRYNFRRKTMGLNIKIV